MTTHLLVAGLVAFGIALTLTPALGHVATRRYWLDQPNHRSSHLAPTPRVGGIAILVASVAGIAMAIERFEWWMVAVAFSAILLSTTGFLDDLHSLGAITKFAAQVLAGVITVAALEPRISIEMPYDALTLSVGASASLTVFWIVSVINATNFLDGLDGLAGGVAIITAVVLAAMVSGPAPAILLPFAAAVAGFFIWNSQPASIFMGDSGSQVIGYVLAMSIFLGDGSSSDVVPVLFVFMPMLFDAAITIVRRLLSGRSPFSADRNHVFHGLTNTGLDHRTTASLYYGATALSAIGGIAYSRASDGFQTALMICSLALTAFLAVYLILRAELGRERSGRRSHRMHRKGVAND